MKGPVLKARLVVALVATSIAGTLVAAAPADAGTGSPAASEATPPSARYAPSVRAARDYALKRIGSTQFRCLDVLWERESHWNPLSHDRTSGAHGIPQAVPGSKMRSAGADWYANPLTQVKWGLGYVRGRYGSACAALHHSDVYGWY